MVPQSSMKARCFIYNYVLAVEREAGRQHGRLISQYRCACRMGTRLLSQLGCLQGQGCKTISGHGCRGWGCCNLQLSEHSEHSEQLSKHSCAIRSNLSCYTQIYDVLYRKSATCLEYVRVRQSIIG